eukprot:CAMPEP_0177288804 /NCGR_PEP_ID=MMETSP0367-20130122/74862_1 /TAXON_ID=447022 ORGANISM="Scrippsiella hangoei-like, Strain SHHI-4" /NCGR_SAMPLE_ID=MMETSP0367 /ASSEMBLY_ACC=CAM_ASM_000362 /LENGTH=137 /DNA_ID=CAMNT_0018746163 /DNA_START=232 /DNA_END=641 /DNA_ORIENTATION=-
MAPGTSSPLEQTSLILVLLGDARKAGGGQLLRVPDHDQPPTAELQGHERARLQALRCFVHNDCVEVSREPDHVAAAGDAERGEQDRCVPHDLLLLHLGRIQVRHIGPGRQPLPDDVLQTELVQRGVNIRAQTSDVAL